MKSGLLRGARFARRTDRADAIDGRGTWRRGAGQPRRHRAGEGVARRAGRCQRQGRLRADAELRARSRAEPATTWPPTSHRHAELSWMQSSTYVVVPTTQLGLPSRPLPTDQTTNGMMNMPTPTSDQPNGAGSSRAPTHTLATAWAAQPGSHLAFRRTACSGGTRAAPSLGGSSERAVASNHRPETGTASQELQPGKNGVTMAHTEYAPMATAVQSFRVFIQSDSPGSAATAHARQRGASLIRYNRRARSLLS